VSHRRSNHSRIPHLELRPQGYVWRRRIPQELIRLSAQRTEFDRISIDKSSLKFSHLGFKLTNKRAVSRNSPPSLGGSDNFQPRFESENFQSAVATTQFVPCLPLRTSVFSVAAELARRLSGLSDQIFAYATTMPLTAQQTTTLLTHLARFEIEAADLERARTSPRSQEAAQAAMERNAATQAALRRCFVDGDYSVAEEPLRVVAEYLGIALPPAASDDAKLLAYEATRVLLDVHQDAQRRDHGEFARPSRYFTQALEDEAATVAGTPRHHAPQLCASETIPNQSKETEMNFLPRFLSVRSRTDAYEPPTPEPEAAHQNPPGQTPERRDVRSLLREKNVLRCCSEAVIEILEKREAMDMTEAFEVYIQLKEAGCSDDWTSHQKPDQAIGDKWKKSSAGGLRAAQKIWGSFLGAAPIGECPEDKIDDTVVEIRCLPKYHGKGDVYSGSSCIALIQATSRREAANMDAAERELRAAGCKNEAQIRDARLAHAIPRLRADTYIKHVRAPNRVGKMLVGLGILDENPFRNCTFSNREERALKASEENISRQPWDDRFFELLETPVTCSPECPRSLVRSVQVLVLY